MDNLARLRLRIDSSDVPRTTSALQGLSQQGQRTERATDSLTASFKRFAAPVIGVAGAVASLKKTLSITREFDVLNAQLVTATGSLEGATSAFVALQSFASSTPFSLSQVTQAFTKLVNQGLEPSEAALVSYGNTASALSKTLDQVIEAVGDATRGEFERLKEAFNIVGRAEGDNVALTFRGITTTVRKNAEEISGYLRDIGDTAFAGAMQERMQTLDGAVSNLGDTWNALWREVSDQGVGDLIEYSVRSATEALEDVISLLASGQFEAYLGAIGHQFSGFSDDVGRATNAINSYWADMLGGMSVNTTEFKEFFTEAFRDLPVNVRTAVQLMVVEVTAFVESGIAHFRTFGEIIGLQLAKLVDKAKAYGKAIANALNPFADEDYDLEANLRRIDTLAADMADEALKRVEREVDAKRQARRESILAIIEERNKSVELTEAKIRGANRLRDAYDEEREAEKNITKDRLAQFSQASKGPKGPTASQLKEQEKAAKARQRELQRQKEAQQKAFDSLQDSLLTEEETIDKSYKKRLAIILMNTEQGSQKQLDLKRRLDDSFATEALGDLIEAPDTFEEQVNQLQQYYEARRELILSNTQLTEEQRTELEERLTLERNERLETLERNRTSFIYKNSSELFGGLAEITGAFAGEQSDVYRALFATSKAFAIADSIIKIQQGIASAASLPFPSNLVAAAEVARQTGSIVSTIQGTSFSGAYDNGGIIRAGSVGLVGEFGPELVAGPANVRSRRETAEILKDTDNKTTQTESTQKEPVNPTIINVLDPALLSSYLDTSEGEAAIVNIMQRNQGALSA